jgi:hypothetical protein
MTDLKRLMFTGLLGGGLLLLSFVQPLSAQEPDAAPMPRADSLRAVVLDRIRPPEPPEEPDPDSVAVEPSVSPVPASRVRMPAEVPEDADSLMTAIAGLPGFSSASYRGVRADFLASERRLVLQGSDERRATFSGDGNRLEADSSIIYEDRDGRVRTTGLTDFLPERGDPVRSRTLIYDLQASRGTAVEAQTTYTEGGRWIVQGNLDSVEEGLLFGSSARFTTCDLEVPHSYFQASQIKVIANQVLVARSVRMYVEDVPVLWLPFIAQNLGPDRSSGLLTPVFSMNDVVRTSTGYNRRVSNIGFYWAMSDYSDLTLAMDWYSNNYTALEVGMNYAWSRQFLQGRLNTKRYWGVSGRQELGFNTAHDWRPTERLTLRGSASYISSSDFVLRNSLDPREISQTVDSNFGLTQRLNWGNLTLGASRQQHLNEDRTQLVLPSGSFSLTTLTLLAAPPQTASWYNNIGLSGSTNWNRRLEERPIQPDTAFVLNRASRERLSGSARGSLSLGDLSVQGNLQTAQSTFRDVPAEFFDEPPGVASDFREGDISWSTSLSYRQRLIGTTTLSPNLSLEGSMVRVDSIPEARSFVSGPVRSRFGLSLQSDIYGFYGGFGPFEAVRHKVTPRISWSYAPEVERTDLQDRVFGAGFSRVQNMLTFGFNQTWEARVEEDAAEARPAPAPAGTSPTGFPGAEPEEEGQDGLGDDEAPDDEAADDEAPLDQLLVTPADGGPARLPPSRIVTLLALNTSALTYDVMQADSTGRFVDGFTTTTLSNTVSSDYLRGLSLSFAHNLFDDSGRMDEEGGGRRFSPHLSQVNLGFGLNHQSGLVNLVRRAFGVESGPPVDDDEPDEEIPEQRDGLRSGFDPNRVIPGETGDPEPRTRRQGWDANFQYSLQRPRTTGTVTPDRFQTVSSQLSFAPTENWSVDWRTSYDIESGRFNDHVVRLNRDLHEWEASFSFRQTVTGNWSFQFEVSLRANQDLRFDFEQRSLEGGTGPAF